jgi:arylsulfatase A-like enzyme
MRSFSCLGWLLLGACASAPRVGPPNFVVVYVDDVGYGDLACYGSQLATPHLDRLAAEGLRFTDFYSAAAICTPSRAALLTGRYPPRTGLTRVLFPRDDEGLPPAELTIPEVLAPRGYVSACIGKWHLGHHPEHLPRAQGFDSYYGVPYSNDMDKVEGADRDLDRAWRERDFSPWNVPLLVNEEELERPADQTTLTARYTDRAIEFIEANRDRPFFLYLAHTMPHIPLFVADDLWVEDPELAYAQVMLELDRSVGRLLDALDETGLSQDTVFVFTSDNGPWLSMKHHGGSAGGLRGGKFETWEGGMRVPCLMRWPGHIEAGTTTAELGATLDLLPTFARLAGAPLPTDRVIDGRDLGPVLAGGTRERPPFHFYRGKQLEAVRDGRWKLHLRKGDEERVELYDLVNDPGEQEDLAAAHPELVQRMETAAASFEDLDAVRP